MKTFTNKDVEDYYNQSEVHYRMFWKLKESMGLHYGIWDSSTKNIGDAVLNTNHQLMTLGGIKATDNVLDAGCGIGGSSIYLAKHAGCTVTGITLSKKQVETATALANEKGVGDKVRFFQKDYTATGFPDNTFDVVWAIESMQTALNKDSFFKEMNRILKPGGRILFADIFKPQPYDISREKDMQIMLNGWAMTDILSISELQEVTAHHQFAVTRVEDVSKPVEKSVKRIYWAASLGKIGTKAYNLFRKASYFSRIHYTTGLAQYKTYYKHQWGYYLILCTSNKQ